MFIKVSLIIFGFVIFILPFFNRKWTPKTLIIVGILTMFFSLYDLCRSEREKNEITIEDFNFSIRALYYPRITDIEILNCSRKSFVLHSLYVKYQAFDIYFSRSEDIVKQVGGRMPEPAELLYNQNKIINSASNNEVFKLKSLDELKGKEIILQIKKDLFDCKNTKWTFRGTLVIKGKSYSAEFIDNLDMFHYGLKFRL